MNGSSTYRRHRTPRGPDWAAGFTLIELIIVVLILSVLAGIVVLAVGNFPRSAKRSACKHDYRVVETAQQARKGDTGSFAASTSALVAENYLREAPPPPPATATKSYGIETGTDGTVTVSVWTGSSATSGTSASKCDEIA